VARSATKKRSGPSRPQPTRGKGKASQRRAANRRRSLPWYRRLDATSMLVAAAVIGLIGFALLSRGGTSEQGSPTTPVVGGDLHSLVVDPADPSILYAGGHEAVSVSRDGGKTWTKVQSLDNADAMGWAFTDDAILVGGHPGISVSTDGGKTFEARNEGLPSTDVHALGAGTDVIYAGLAGVGTSASTDGGESWEMRSDQVGGAFMGRIQVDPSDDEHLIAPDMGAGAVESTDGGRKWDALGGIQGAMWVSWDARDTDHIIVTGQGAAAESTDGGQSWEPLETPEGASIIEFSPHDSEVLFAAVLEAPEASIYVSGDGGKTWTRP
jgi:photosystem II stability/assembly factor-like uncharacterized protein